LFGLAKEVNKGRRELEPTLRYLYSTLGFMAKKDAPGLEKEEVGNQRVLREFLLALRQDARANKDYELADRIRDRFVEAGYQIRDEATGPQIVSLFET
jgi:cysteinyl-tRNA synthetase